MKLSKELKTAFIVLGGILLFILGFSYLKSNPIFSSHRTYYAVYDNVGGLATGTSVTINGFPVGKVLDIRFMDEKGKLLVTFSIESDFEFSKNSKAELFDTGIIGGKAIQIIPAFDTKEIAQSGDTLQSTIKPGLTELVTQKLTPLQEKFENMLVSADSVLIDLNQIMDESTKKNIQSSIANLNATVSNFKNASKSLNDLVTANKQKLDNSLENVNTITENFAKLSDTLAQANLGKTISELQKTVTNFNAVLKEMEEGKGTIGKLLKDDEMYDNLSDASRQLELLLKDMRINPKRYVHFSLFGKRAKKYEAPPEEEKPKPKEQSQQENN